jgi:hypothetical protein
MFYSEAAAHPNMDQALVAASAAQLLIHANRTVTWANLDVFAKFGERLLQIADVADALAILEHFGLDPLGADAALAFAGSVAEDYALEISPGVRASVTTSTSWTPPPDTPFGPFKKAKEQPFWFYIGNAAHLTIAEWYTAQHPEPAHRVQTNIEPLSKIISLLQAYTDFKAGHIRQALARAKPDIFDYSILHGLPPVWLYEIKSWRAQSVAEFEVAFYAAAMILANIPVVPGPRNAAGTYGILPAPNGWFVFGTPVEGVITYEYKQATKRQLEEREQKRVEEELGLKLMKLTPLETNIGVAMVVAALALIFAPEILIIEAALVM